MTSCMFVTLGWPSRLLIRSRVVTSLCSMSVCSVRLVLALLAAAVAVTGLNIDGDPIVPSVVIHVWANAGATTTEQTDIETNKIPHKHKPQTLRKLIPNYDFPVVPVVKGKSPPKSDHVVHLCRSPQRPLGWSWRLWVRQRGSPRFNIDAKLGHLPLSPEEGSGAKEVVIGGKLGGAVEELSPRKPYTKHAEVGRVLSEESEEEKAARRSYTKHVKISAKLGEVLGEEEEEGVEEKVTYP